MFLGTISDLTAFFPSKNCQKFISRIHRSTKKCLANRII